MALFFFFCDPPSYAFQEGLLFNRPSEKSIIPTEDQQSDWIQLQFARLSICWFPYNWMEFYPKRHQLSEIMCIFASKIDKRNVEQWESICTVRSWRFPKLSRWQDTDACCFFRVCVGLPPLHIVQHRMKFFSVLF